MKHFFLLAALRLLPLSSAKAQYVEFAPSGAEWFYHYQSGWVQSDGFFHAQNLGDTLLNGRVCKKICTSYFLRPTMPPYCNSTSSIRYMYQQDDSIFEYNPLGELRLLFRNNFQTGDSLYYYDAPFVVTGIDTVTFNNQPVRRFYLSDAGGIFKPIIYDRFGPQDGLFDFSRGVVADGGTFGLRCYQDATFPQVNVAGEACDLVLHAQEPLTAIRIYPNPAHDFILLELDGYRHNDLLLHIWDAAGRLVTDQLVQTDLQPIDVQTLPAGFYLLAVQAGEAIVQQKFIKN